MSSILKALRKVEDEKASIGQGSVDLAHDILKRSYKDKKSPPVAVLMLSVFAVLAIFMGAGVWWFWPENTPLPETRLVEQTPAPAIQTPVESLSPPQPQMENAPVQTAVAPAAVPVVKPPEKVAGRSAEIIVPQPAAEPVALIEIPPLRIDEIVFHQDPLSRLAVINDLPVMQGTDIDGAHVLEILPSEVVFSYQGIRFRKTLNGPP